MEASAGSKATSGERGDPCGLRPDSNDGAITSGNCERITAETLDCDLYFDLEESLLQRCYTPERRTHQSTDNETADKPRSTAKSGRHRNSQRRTGGSQGERRTSNCGLILEEVSADTTDQRQTDLMSLLQR